MGTKTTKYTKAAIQDLPNDKPVLYRIETVGGRLNYAGIAKRGRVTDRIGEHVGEIPGATVKIEQGGEGYQEESTKVQRTRKLTSEEEEDADTRQG